MSSGVEESSSDSGFKLVTEYGVTRDKLSGLEGSYIFLILDGGSSGIRGLSLLAVLTRRTFGLINILGLEQTQGLPI